MEAAYLSNKLNVRGEGGSQEQRICPMKTQKGGFQSALFISICIRIGGECREEYS